MACSGGRCCALRKNCICCGLWLLIYYSSLAFLMYYEIKNAKMRFTQDSKGVVSYEKKTHGFWVLGIAYILMDFFTLFFIFGAIMKRYTLLIIFIFGQCIPISVECFYLLVALLYGIEIETFFIYVLPLMFLVYIDVLSYSYWQELRRLNARRSVATIDIEY